MTKEGANVNDNPIVTIARNEFWTTGTWVRLPSFTKVVALIHTSIAVIFPYFSQLWKNYFIVFISLWSIFTTVSIIPNFHISIWPCPSRWGCDPECHHNFWGFLKNYYYYYFYHFSHMKIQYFYHIFMRHYLIMPHGYFTRHPLLGNVVYYREKCLWRG